MAAPVSASTLRTALSFGALLLASTALADPVPGGRQQLELLRAIPTEVLTSMSKGGQPDHHGMVGHNRSRWTGAQYQRSGAEVLMDAASRANRKEAEQAWTAVEAAFAHLRPDGTFDSRNESGTPAARKDVFSDSAFWLAHLGQAILVLRESPLAPAFRDRIEALLPRFRAAAHLLLQSKEALTLREERAPNRYFIDGLACSLWGHILDDKPLRELGEYFVDLGLSKQQADGYFLEAGGADTSYNAVSIGQIQVLDLYFPSPRFDAALSRAVAWEIRHIKPDGTIDVKGNSRTGLGQERYFGKPKEINYNEVALALLYYGYRHHDEPAISAGLRVHQRGQHR